MEDDSKIKSETKYQNPNVTLIASVIVALPTWHLRAGMNFLWTMDPDVAEKSIEKNKQM